MPPKMQNSVVFKTLDNFIVSKTSVKGSKILDEIKEIHQILRNNTLSNEMKEEYAKSQRKLILGYLKELRT